MQERILCCIWHKCKTKINFLQCRCRCRCKCQRWCRDADNEISKWSQYDTYLVNDLIKEFSGIIENFSAARYYLNSLMSVLYFTSSMITKCRCLNNCIRAHRELFRKGSPLPIPQWFNYGRNCCLTRKSVLENFPVYLSYNLKNFNLAE